MTTAAPPVAGLASLIGGLAARLDHLGTGPLAELRRLRADAEDRWRTAAFYRLYVELIAPDHAGGDEHERRWAMILSGMTRLPHQPGRNAGSTMAEYDLAERRFVRLLDADAEHLASELRGIVSFLAAKGTSANWTDLADLVLSVDSERRDGVRRRLASAFYRTPAKTKKG